MATVLITKKHSDILSRHAKECFPNECIGIFECLEKDGNYLVTNVYRCKNIARKKRTGAQFAKREFKYFCKKSQRLKRSGVFLGVYHSHPVSASTKLGDQDKYSAMLYRLFRLQLILGIKASGKIRRGFWKINQGKDWELLKIKKARQ